MMDPFWKWWILAGVLLILESLAPGFVFLWMGIAAALVGLVAWLLPHLSPALAWVLFAIFSLSSILIWIKIRKPQSAQIQVLNKRGQEYVGRNITLTQPISNGAGKIQLGDTFWTLVGPDCPAGTQVTIVAVESGKLRIIPTAAPNP